MSAHRSADELRERVEASLQPGESLLWVGQPDPKQFWSEAAAVFVFAFIPLGAGLVGVFLFLATGPSRGLLTGLMGSLFCAIGVWLLISPWQIRRRLRQTIYALTDRRALIWKGVGWSASAMLPSLDELYYEFGPETLRYCSRRRRSRRRIDVVFGEEHHRSRRGSSVVEVGFLGLGHPEFVLVDHVLRERFPSPDPDQSTSTALEGALHPAPLALRVLGVIVVVAVFSPWLIIAAGLILVGALSLIDFQHRGELWFCLLSGLLLGLLAFLGYCFLRAPATITSFAYDGYMLSYRTQSGKKCRVPVDEIVAITERRCRDAQESSGWALELRGGKPVFLSAQTANAAELVSRLRCSGVS